MGCKYVMILLVVPNDWQTLPLITFDMWNKPFWWLGVASVDQTTPSRHPPGSLWVFVIGPRSSRRGCARLNPLGSRRKTGMSRFTKQPRPLTCRKKQPKHRVQLLAYPAEHRQRHRPGPAPLLSFLCFYSYSRRSYAVCCHVAVRALHLAGVVSWFHNTLTKRYAATVT